IRSARVSSLGRSVVDAFYVTGADGQPVPAAARTHSETALQEREGSVRGRFAAFRPKRAPDPMSVVSRVLVVPVGQASTPGMLGNTTDARAATGREAAPGQGRGCVQTGGDWPVM